MDLYLAMLSSMPISERKMVCLRGYNNQLLMNVSIIIMQRKPLWIAPTTVCQFKLNGGEARLALLKKEGH